MVKESRKTLTLAIFAIVLLLINFPFAKANSSDLDNKTDEIIAVKKQNTTLHALERELISKNIYFKSSHNSHNNVSFTLLKAESGKDLGTLVNELKNTGLFEIIEPNYKLKSDYDVTSSPVKKIIPNDESFKKQFYLNQTKVTSAWLFSLGSPSIPIAVLDSGVDYTNLDLIERVLPCVSFIESSTSCQDDFGHGTQVASIIGAKSDNKLGLAGISWLNPILPVKVSNENGIATVSTVVQGLDYALKSGAKIAIISLSTDKKSEVLRIAVEQAQEKGLLVIASGGNTGTDGLRYPAGFEGVIGVGSISSNYEKSRFSTTGTHIKIVSPGENILVPSITSDSLEVVSGTSFSAPQVAGIAALVWALRPTYTNKDIQRLLLSTTVDLGKPGYDSYFGYGLIDAEIAIKRALLKYEKE